MIDDKRTYKNGKYINITPIFAGTSSLVSVDGSATIIKTLSRNTEWSRAFDDDDSTWFRSGISEPVNRYIGLQFTEPKVVTMYRVNSTYNADYTAKTFYLIARNSDSDEWVNLEEPNTVTKTEWTDAGTEGLCFQIDNATAYTQYAIWVTAKNSTNSICFNTIEFYKDDEADMTFVKCLESELPDEVSGGVDKIFLTEKGNIYMTRKDGTLKQMSPESIGSLESLTTTDKSSVVAAINETNVNLGVLEGALNNNSYTKDGLNYFNCAYVDGGYCKVGNLVIINIRILVQNNSIVHIEGFPSMLTKSSKNIVAASCFDMISEDFNAEYCVVNANGTATIRARKGESLIVGNEYTFSATYICD